MAGNEAGEVGRAASCWTLEAVVRDLNFNPRVMEVLGGLACLLFPLPLSLLESFEHDREGCDLVYLSKESFWLVDF